MLFKIGEEIVTQGAGGAIHDQHAACAAFGGRLLRNQLFGKFVIEICDTEFCHGLSSAMKIDVQELSLSWSGDRRYRRSCTSFGAFPKCASASQPRAFDGGVQFLALRLEVVLGEVRGNLRPAAPN